MDPAASDRRDSGPPARGELALIERIRLLLAGVGEVGAPSGVPFGDDMASIAADSDLLWTTDVLMDGVDFDSRIHGWVDVGRKAMAVSLSDCAAMGCKPVGGLLAVTLSDDLDMDDALAIVRGAERIGREFGCPITGGDTNSWKHPTVVATTVAARAEPGCLPVRRNGARAGDAIYVTGMLGGSLLGRHMTFVPRVDAGLAINRAIVPRAMIDISDGFALDLWRVCQASGVGATVLADAIDRMTHSDAHERARSTGRSPREHALHDGEDFQLIVVARAETVPVGYADPPLHRIGIITAEREMNIAERDGRETPLPARGWEHFK